MHFKRKLFYWRKCWLVQEWSWWGLHNCQLPLNTLKIMYSIVLIRPGVHITVKGVDVVVEGRYIIMNTRKRIFGLFKCIMQVFFTRFGKISGRVWSSPWFVFWRDSRSSQIKYPWWDQTSPDIFSVESSKNLHDYIFIILDQQCIFENKSLSTWETSFIREPTYIRTRFPRLVDRTPSKDNFWREFWNECVRCFVFSPFTFFEAMQ